MRERGREREVEREREVPILGLSMDGITGHRLHRKQGTKGGLITMIAASGLR
jgi:hypothetical protein